MSKVSIIVPSRNERFLPQTIHDLAIKAAGDVEIIVVLDGYWPDPPLPDYPNLVIIHNTTPKGLRAAINAGASIARGEYLMKTDAHCAFEPGYDEILKTDCDVDWLVIPRRDRLDAENWCLQSTGKPPIDYHYLSCPITNQDGYAMHGAIDNQRAKERSAPEYDIDETMSFQGSLWFCHKRFFWDVTGGGMNEAGYGTFTQEPQELGMKVWLSGGKIMTNKKTTYLHLHKGRTYGRGYILNEDTKAGHFYSAVYWMFDKWEKRICDMEWFIDRFWPVPSWPLDWKSRKDDSVFGKINYEHA